MKQSKETLIRLKKEMADEKASFEASLADSQNASESKLDEKIKSCELQKLEIENLKSELEKLRTEISISDRITAGIKARASENNPNNIQSYGNPPFQNIHNFGGTVNNGQPISNGNGGGNNWHPPSDGGGNNNWRPPSDGGGNNNWQPPSDGGGNNGGNNNWRPLSDGGSNNWRPSSGPFHNWYPPSGSHPSYQSPLGGYHGWNSH